MAQPVAINLAGGLLERGLSGIPSFLEKLAATRQQIDAQKCGKQDSKTTGGRLSDAR
ncbi:hypothetical protein ACQR16_13660 [Bradyrhizobium oligotrophicum]|uniref:hypothetical protein n=1 Tax=Bradyrhizobium oligotrophicum TaxID=44255 RepID=UPI003EB88EF2